MAQMQWAWDAPCVPRDVREPISHEPRSTRMHCNGYVQYKEPSSHGSSDVRQHWLLARTALRVTLRPCESGHISPRRLQYACPLGMTDGHQCPPPLVGRMFERCACMEITSDQTKATADIKGIRIDDGTRAKLNHCAGPHNAMPEMDEPFHSRLSVRADSPKSHCFSGSRVVDHR